MKIIYRNRIKVIILLSLFLGGCFLPKVVQENEQECKLSTKKLTLEYSEIGTHAGANAIHDAMLIASIECDTPECLLIIPLGILAVPVGSFIVSGSIVVVGNTIHWIEKQGRCKDSAILRAVNDLVESEKKVRGKLIQSGKQLIDWFNRQLLIGSDS